MIEKNDLPVSTYDDKALQERQKLMYDLFKHLTTLNTASILILITLLEKLFVNPRWKILIAISFIGFILSILGSLYMMFIIPDTVIGKTVSPSDWAVDIFVVTVASFILSLISLVVFSLKNFF